MKSAKYSKTANERLMHKYRAYRNGIMTLSHLESNLVMELEKLSEVHVPVSKVPIEKEYLIQSLRTIRHEIRSTYQSLAFLKQAVENSKLSKQEIEKVIHDQLKDSPHRQDIFVRIRALGGPLKFLDYFLQFLRPRYDKYTTCIDMLKESTASKDGERTLAELAIKVEDCIPSNPDIAYKICWNPLSCIIVVVVIVGTIIATEGEAGGEEEEGEVGDFPEPDPDGDRPA